MAPWAVAYACGSMFGTHTSSLHCLRVRDCLGRGRAQDQRRFCRSGLIGLELHQTQANGAVPSRRWFFTHVGSYYVRIHKLCAILTGLFWLSDACTDLRHQFAMVSAGAQAITLVLLSRSCLVNRHNGEFT